MSKVFLNKIDTYYVENLKEIYRKIFDELNIKDKIKKDSLVVIKPNLVIKSKPDSGIITHPSVVAAVGLLFKEMGAKILIAESSGGLFTPSTCKMVFSGSGYTEMAEKYGFSLYLDAEYEKVVIKNPFICGELSVIKPYINPDFVVDIAKLKSHCMTGISGAVKNLFGVVPGLMKPELHCRFPEESDFVKMLTDVCRFVDPDLCIMDAIEGLEGDGPTGGVKRHMGFTAVSEDPYALDFVSAEIIGMKQSEVKMIKFWMDNNLAPSSLDEVDIIGNIDELRQKDFLMPRSKNTDMIERLPKFLRPVAKKIATPKPVINSEKCVGCGKCAESCPQHTINLINKKAVINYKNCIKCFCCHEMCPIHVIDIKRLKIFNL